MSDEHRQLVEGGARTLVDVERRFYTQHFFLALLNTFRPTMHFSLWLLAATGAVLGAVVTRADDVEPLLGSTAMNVLLIGASLSFVPALAARWWGHQVELPLVVYEYRHDALEHQTDKFTDEEVEFESRAAQLGVPIEVDFDMREIAAVLGARAPRFARTWLQQQLVSGTEFDALQRAVRALILQNVAVFTQLVLVAGTIIAVALARALCGGAASVPHS